MLGEARPVADPLERQAVARGCVYVVDPPLPCPPDGRWEGEVRFVRGHERLRPGPGLWLLQFEDGVQQRWVKLESVQDTWTASGLRGTAHVFSYDERFPAQVVELGGDG